jgi:hypothetical protein
MQNKVNFSFRLEDCLMTFSDNTLQRLWRQYCKVYSFLSNQKCLTGRGNLADWALAMPCCQSVWQINLSLWNETLSNCVDLKETLVSLRHYKVSGEMSKKPILLIPTLSSWYIMTWQNVCVWIIFTVYASVPLHEQTCHVCFEVAIEILHSPQLPRKFLMTVVVKEDGLGDGYGAGSSCCQWQILQSVCKVRKLCGVISYFFQRERETSLLLFFELIA